MLIRLVNETRNRSHDLECIEIKRKKKEGRYDHVRFIRQGMRPINMTIVSNDSGTASPQLLIASRMLNVLENSRLA